MTDRKLPVIQGDYCYRIKAACPEQRGADTVLLGRLQHRVKQLRNALAWIWSDPPPPPTCATCRFYYVLRGLAECRVHAGHAGGVHGVPNDGSGYCHLHSEVTNGEARSDGH